MPDSLKQSPPQKDKAFSVLQSCPDCAVVLDRQWTLVYANPAFQERFCGEREAEGNNFLTYLDLPSSEQVRELQPQLFQYPRQVELRMVTEGSGTASLQYSFFPLLVSGSAEVFLAGIGRDRSADLALLNEVIQLNIELKQKHKELLEANARLEQLAITDQLTQLLNRDYFFKVAQHFWNESRRYNHPLVTIMLDIDNFKLINDTSGHLVGSHVLKELSLRLQTTIRKSDILARYGGDELSLLASNTDMMTGLVLAERLRSSVASEPFVWGDRSASVTISLGVSGTEMGDFASFEALLDSSDRALYDAKHAGKNCLFAYQGP